MTEQIPKEFKAPMEKATKVWGQRENLLDELKEFHLFQDLVQMPVDSVGQAFTQFVEDQVAILADENNELATVLTLRFKEKRRVSDVARELNIAEATVYLRQNAALKRLTEISYEQELALQQAKQAEMRNRLEASTYTNLIGVDQVIDDLLAQIANPNSPQIIALVGTGGIGKTSTAHALMCRLLDDPDYGYEIGWITARHSRYSFRGQIQRVVRPLLKEDDLIDALWRQICGPQQTVSLTTSEQKTQMLYQQLQRPHVIVIDNLETLSEVESLLPDLRRMPKATRFLLTSRVRIDGGVGIYHHVLSELSAQDSLTLLRQEAMENGYQLLATADDEALLPIYRSVGGNPLALRLVVGLAQVHALDHIASSLHSARGETVENLYTYIFAWAWEELSAAAQQVWLVFPLLTHHSGTVRRIQAITGLSERSTDSALEQLIRMNLIYSEGTLHERYYTIHSLTRTYLTSLVHADAATHTQPSIPTGTLEIFRRHVGQNVQCCITELNNDHSPLTESLISHALLALNFALEMDDQWPSARELLYLLTAHFEQTEPHAEWGSCLERAIAHAEQMNDEHGAATLCCALGLQLRKSGEFGAAATHFMQAQSFAQRAQARLLEVKALIELAHVYQMQQRLNDAKTTALQAQALLSPDDAEQAAVHAVLGDIYYEQHEWSQAADALQQAIAWWEQGQNRTAAASGWRGLARVRLQQADATAALRCYENALNLYDTTTDSLQYAITCMGFGALLVDVGQFAKGLELLGRAEPLLRAVQNHTYLAMLYYNGGLAHYSRTEWPQARQHFQATLEQLDLLAQSQPDDQVRRVRVLTHLGETYAQLREYELAIASLHEAQDLLPQIREWADLERYRTRIAEEQQRIAATKSIDGG